MAVASSWLQCEVVDDEQADLGEAPHLGFGAVVESRCSEPLEHCISTQHEGGDPASHCDVAECGGEVGLADPDRTQDDRPVRGAEEPQTGQISPHRAVVAHRGVVVPGVDAHGRVQARGAGPAGCGAGVAAGSFIGEDQFEERGAGQVLLAGQGQPFGQRVEHG